MISWILLLFLPFSVLLLIEELAQYFWRDYLIDKQHSQQTIISKFFLHTKQTLNKLRRNPMH